MGWVIRVLLPGKTAAWYTGCRGIGDVPLLVGSPAEALAYYTDGCAWADIRLARRAFPTARFSVEVQ